MSTTLTLSETLSMAASKSGKLIKRFVLDPRWFSSTVIDLAQAIFCCGVPERFPVLSDAFMDAGCDDQVIIATCQDQREGWTYQRYLLLFSILNQGPWLKNAKTWTVYVPKGLTTQMAFDLLTELGRDKGFKTFSYYQDLDEQIRHDRSKDQAWTIQVRVSREAQEGSNQTTQELWQEAFVGETLTERLLLEILHVAHYQSHLDETVWDRTLCSRDSYGLVPVVSFSLDDRRVGVGCWSVGGRSGSVRSRSVVSS